MTPAEFEAARRKLGYTQPQLAAALGISASMVYSIEAGRRGMDERTPGKVQQLYVLAMLALLAGLHTESHTVHINR
jgi:transcriptional regulator with XRE-family HTH domain